MQFPKELLYTWGYNGTNWHPVRIDASTRTMQTIEYEHHEIHGGSHYNVHGFLDIVGVDDVLDFTWQMPDTTKEIHWLWQIYTEKAIAWYIYMDAVATNGLDNTITPINSDHKHIVDKPSVTVLKYELQADLATANADTDVTTATVIASGRLGDNKGGGVAGRGNESILKRNSLYCLRAVASAAGYINFDMNWYEHTPKEA